MTRYVAGYIPPSVPSAVVLLRRGSRRQEPGAFIQVQNATRIWIWVTLSNFVIRTENLSAVPSLSRHTRSGFLMHTETPAQMSIWISNRGMIETQREVAFHRTLVIEELVQSPTTIPPTGSSATTPLRTTISLLCLIPMS